MEKNNIRGSIFKNKKEEGRTAIQKIVHRKGKIPDWVKEESDQEEEEEDIFSNCEHKDIDEDEDEIYSLEIETRKEKAEPRDEKLEQRMKLRREIYKTEIINDVQVQEPEKLDFSKRREERLAIINSQQPESKNIEENQLELELLSLLGDDNQSRTSSKNSSKSIYSKNKNENISGNTNLINFPTDTKNNLEESSYTTEDLEESSADEEVLLRPVFVSKEARLTLDEDNQDSIQKEIQEEKAKLKSIRKKETKDIVKKLIEEEKKDKDQMEDNNEGLPDDTDDLDNIEEYEQWKLRELRRIKYQFEESEKKLKEKVEIERRRNLTDEQRKEENLRLGSDDTLRPFTSKLNFLQKYYHRGVFFMSEGENLDHIYNRDFNLPTWEDKVDRSNLPKIMQVRRGLLFKKGRTKYTHLTAEDTTNFDPTYKVPENIASKLTNNLGGYKSQNVFDMTGRKRK